MSTTMPPRRILTLKHIRAVMRISQRTRMILLRELVHFDFRTPSPVVTRCARGRSATFFVKGYLDKRVVIIAIVAAIKLIVGVRGYYYVVIVVIAIIITEGNLQFAE